MSRLRGDLADALARRAGAPEAISASIPVLWRPADMRPSDDAARTDSSTVWVAHQGLVAHPAGSATDFLLFDYPLTGTYEVSLDAYVGPSAASVVSLGGLAVLPSIADGAARVFPIGANEHVRIPWTLSRPTGFNRLTIQVEPTKVRYLVNGHLLYQDDDPSSTSPWLGLLTDRERNSAWRSLKIHGDAKIPREVRLSQADRLEGWVASFYGETVPTRWTEQRTNQYGNFAQVAVSRGVGPNGKPASRKSKVPVVLDDFDWAAQDGVIHGRRVFATANATANANANAATRVLYQENPSATEANQSRLYYFRPIHDGDTISYEFLYEPGEVMVHPAIDRLAFLLEEGGVRIHWMAAGGTDLLGLPADNVADEPNNRRGPKPIPLKAGEWNAVKLSVKANTVTLDLNGQTVYERPLESSSGRQFGLFHFKDQTSAQARNLVLRGHWPEALSSGQLTDLLRPDPTAPDSESIRRARHAVIGEPLFALQVDDILEKAEKLPVAERYRLLADWVLPSPDHPVVRLEGSFSPSFPPPGLSKSISRRKPMMAPGDAFESRAAASHASRRSSWWIPPNFWGSSTSSRNALRPSRLIRTPTPAAVPTREANLHCPLRSRSSAVTMPPPQRRLTRLRHSTTRVGSIYRSGPVGPNWR